MFVSRNPNYKVNEYHTMYCGESIKLYRWGLVEGRGFPNQLEDPYFKEYQVHQPSHWCVVLKTILRNSEDIEYGQ